MLDTERLARICDELITDPAYARGKKRYATPVSTEETIAIAQALAEEVEEGVAARDAQAERQGFRVVCQKGCNSCCNVLVVCYQPEALRIVEFLRKPEQAQTLAAFLSAYGPWKAQAGDVPERAQRAFVEGDQAGYDELHQNHFRRAIPCAFLVDGVCSIYPIRPIGCRNAHALDTNARCVADPPEPAQALDFVPLARIVHRATQLLHALHNVKSRERHGQKSVCVAVHELLAFPKGR